MSKHTSKRMPKHMPKRMSKRMSKRMLVCQPSSDGYVSSKLGKDQAMSLATRIEACELAAIEDAAWRAEPREVYTWRYAIAHNTAPPHPSPSASRLVSASASPPPPATTVDTSHFKFLECQNFAEEGTLGITDARRGDTRRLLGDG